MLRKSLLGILVSFTLTVIWFAPAFAAPEPYLVGASISVTGPGSEPLAPIKDALDIYFKEINAKAVSMAIR